MFVLRIQVGPKLDLQVDNKMKFFRMTEILTSGRLRASRVFGIMTNRSTLHRREEQVPSTQVRWRTRAGRCQMKNSMRFRCVVTAN